MMKKKKSDRIQNIVALVPKCRVLGDIGCDHAHISIYLKEIGRVDKVIATDLREGPLNRARENVRDKGFEESFDLRLCSGLDGLKAGETEVILISGMGGILMRDILEKGVSVLKEVKTLVLEPQSDVFLVREFLRKHGFSIRDERMAREGIKLYQIICADRTDGEEENINSAIFDKYGPILLRNKDKILKEFLLERQAHFERILLNRSFAESMNEGTRERAAFIKEEARDVEKALDFFEEYGNGV